MGDFADMCLENEMYGISMLDEDHDPADEASLAEERDRQPQTRFTTVHDRYTVGNDIEGFVCSFMKKEEALEYATRRTKQHNIAHNVFDIMARKNAINLWAIQLNGSIKTERNNQ